MASNFFIQLFAKMAFAVLVTVLGYFTAKFMVPLLTGGKFALRPLVSPHRSGRAWADRQRRRAGIRLVSAELATAIASAFWLGLLVGYVFVRRWLA